VHHAYKPKVAKLKYCGRAQAFLEIAVSTPHAVETRLDATYCTVALTSCFVKIATFRNAEAAIITPCSWCYRYYFLNDYC
jgi:hypothetical protein